MPFYLPLYKNAVNIKPASPNGLMKRILLLISIIVFCTFSFLNLSLFNNISFSNHCTAQGCQSQSFYGPAHVPPNHLHPLPLDATFEQRLTAFRNAPGVGWEPADFVQWNMQTCSNVVPNHNKDLLAKSTLVWGVLNSSTIIQHRERMIRFLEDQKAAGVFEPLHVTHGGRGYVGEGRGIVFTAGNADTLSRVIITLKLLRERLNCNLPAAIFHFPSERPPLDSPLLAELSSLNAKLVEATGRERDTSRTKNYHLKAQSIVQSEWAEVIYLDSDNLPAANPEFLFDAPNYKRLGVFFTPDYWKTSASNPIWHIIGVQCRDEWEQEAGQIIIDKRRHLDAMLLSLYMLTDWQYWFYFSDGDKDVFRFAMLALRKRWALPGRYVGGGGLPRGTPSGDFCAHTMQQYDHEGRPLFIHYNLLKQIPSGVYLGYTWGRTKQIASYPTGNGLTLDTNHTSASSNPSSSTPPKGYVPYPDPAIRKADDVEADMLANADDNGWTIYPGNEEVRRRAALERGIRPFFHGGGYTAFCIDMRWEDPLLDRRPSEEKTRNALGLDWNVSPLQVAQWSDDDRLRDFEQAMYNLGFHPGGPGF